jgi:hypothetical protein
MPRSRQRQIISQLGSSHSMNGALPITSRCRASFRGRPQAPRKRSAVMIPVRVAQERNTKGVADLTKRRRRGRHRMVTEAQHWAKVVKLVCFGPTSWHDRPGISGPQGANRETPNRWESRLPGFLFENAPHDACAYAEVSTDLENSARPLARKTNAQVHTPHGRARRMS